jgi:hypothetical protein
MIELKEEMKKRKRIDDKTQERRQTERERETDSELKKTRIEIPGLN